MYYAVAVAQLVGYCASNTKVTGLIPRVHNDMYTFHKSDKKNTY